MNANQGTQQWLPSLIISGIFVLPWLALAYFMQGNRWSVEAALGGSLVGWLGLGWIKRVLAADGDDVRTLAETQLLFGLILLVTLPFALLSLGLKFYKEPLLLNPSLANLILAQQWLLAVSAAKIVSSLKWSLGIALGALIVALWFFAQAEAGERAEKVKKWLTRPLKIAGILLAAFASFSIVGGTVGKPLIKLTEEEVSGQLQVSAQSIRQLKRGWRIVLGERLAEEALDTPPASDSSDPLPDTCSANDIAPECNPAKVQEALERKWEVDEGNWLSSDLTMLELESVDDPLCDADDPMCFSPDEPRSFTFPLKARGFSPREVERARVNFCAQSRCTLANELLEKPALRKGLSKMFALAFEAADLKIMNASVVGSTSEFTQKTVNTAFNSPIDDAIREEVAKRVADSISECASPAGCGPVRSVEPPSSLKQWAKQRGADLRVFLAGQFVRGAERQAREIATPRKLPADWMASLFGGQRTGSGPQRPMGRARDGQGAPLIGQADPIVSCFCEGAYVGERRASQCQGRCG